MHTEIKAKRLAETLRCRASFPTWLDYQFWLFSILLLKVVFGLSLQTYFDPCPATPVSVQPSALLYVRISESPSPLHLSFEILPGFQAPAELSKRIAKC